MARGTAGYGRYDDAPDRVGCPWAASDTTACVARDGFLALLPSRKGHACSGCGNTLAYLYEDLATDYVPARDIPVIHDPAADAARFRNMVYRATSPAQQDGGGDDGRT